MIYIDRNLKTSIYLQLYNALKQKIIEEEPSRTPLTPVRTLASELKIAKNCVEQVYQQLSSEGYIYSIPGSGYYRNDVAADLNQSANIKPPFGVRCETQQAPPKYNFQYGSLNNSSFPWNKWRKCIRTALLEEEDGTFLEYQESQGLLTLRKSLVTHLKSTRGVNCSPEQIVMCSGIQDAISILAAVFSPDRYTVGFEDPGYDGSRNTFLRYRYKIQPIKVEDNGLSINDLSEHKCNLVYVTPSHQFPTGSIMPVAGRNRLLALINDRDGFIIEDDYDSEFRYGSSMSIPSLQSLDNNDRVIYLGTFSKSFSPTLRVSYMVLPVQLLAKYHEKYRNYKTPLPYLTQSALHHFVSNGFYARHLRKLVLSNEKKYNAIIQTLHEQNYIQPIASGSGVHILIKMKTHASHFETLQMFEEHEIRLYPTTHYWLDKQRCDPLLFLLGFASMTIEETKEAIAHLVEVAISSDMITPLN